MYEKKLVNKTQKLPLGKLPLGNFLYLCTEIVKFVTKLPIFMKNIGIRSQKSHGRRRTDLCPGLPEDALEW